MVEKVNGGDNSTYLEDIDPDIHEGTIQRNGTIKTIIVTKHLRGEVRKLKVLLCYSYHNGIIDKEEDIIFAT